MARFNTDWEQELKTPPFKKNIFADKQMKHVEERIRSSQTPQLHHRAWLRISLPLAVVCIVGVLLLLRPNVFDSVVKQVNGWFAEPVETLQPQPEQQDPEQQPEQREPIIQESSAQFKGRALALEEPNYWSNYEYAFMINSASEYKLLEVNGDFVKVQEGEQVGWVPSWYIVNNDDVDETARITELEPYEMIVRTSAFFHAYPDLESLTGFELEEGKVVQVLQQYQDWFQIEIKLYAEPMSGNKWIHKDSLMEYNDKDAKEGYLRLTDGGSYIYADLDGKQGKEQISSKTTVRIVEEYEDMYMISSPGGRSGYIRKEDFIPNPFGMTRGTYLELSPAAEEAFHQYIQSRNEEDLRGLEPLDLFKIYQQATIMGDAGLTYDLLIHDEEYYIPSREEYIQEYEEHAQLNQKNEMEYIRRFAETEVKTELRENEAYIQPVHKEDGEWFFRLIKNKDGIWKVSWLAMQ